MHWTVFAGSWGAGLHMCKKQCKAFCGSRGSCTQSDQLSPVMSLRSCIVGNVGTLLLQRCWTHRGELKNKYGRARVNTFSYSRPSSFFSKHGDFITHNATEPLGGKKKKSFILLFTYSVVRKLVKLPIKEALWSFGEEIQTQHFDIYIINEVIIQTNKQAVLWGK